MENREIRAENLDYFFLAENYSEYHKYDHSEDDNSVYEMI